MPQIDLPALEAVVTLNPCEAPPPEPVLTTVAPVREHQSLYLSSGGGCLYALHAVDGTVRWCQQVKLIRTREVRLPPGMSVPPPHRANFAAPRVVKGAKGDGDEVYVVCEYGSGTHTCAFAASDGSLRWWTATDARVSGGHFMDWAAPLVADGIVYSGTYALNEHDGAVRWRVAAINTWEEGPLALQGLANGTLHATTGWGIYAINAHDGHIRWHYQPGAPSYLSGPPVISGQLLYAGTGAAGAPSNGHFFALDVKTGKMVWRFPMGRYIGAMVQHETIYVSSGDRSIHALDGQSGRLRWRKPFAPGQYAAVMAHGVLYLTADGVYAHRSEDGTVLWHQSLESSRSVTFGQPVILDGAVYLARFDNRGRGTIYALGARTGAECWRIPFPTRGAQLAVAQ